MLYMTFVMRVAGQYLKRHHEENADFCVNFFYCGDIYNVRSSLTTELFERTIGELSRHSMVRDVKVICERVPPLSNNIDNLVM